MKFIAGDRSPATFPITGRSLEFHFLRFSSQKWTPEVILGQKDNVSNQREHIIHLLANEQSRLRIPAENEPKLDEAAVQSVFLKSLDNYVKWCSYLVLQPVWRKYESQVF